MRAAAGILAVIVIFSMIGILMSGINDAQTDERIDAFAGVATAVSVTEADVVLVTDPWNDDIINITSIISSNSSDAPLPDSYVTSTNTLTVRGLAEDDTRNLTITYDYGSLEDNAESVNRFLGMIPLFVVIAALCIVIGSGIMFALRVRHSY